MRWGLGYLVFRSNICIRSKKGDVHAFKIKSHNFSLIDKGFWEETLRRRRGGCFSSKYMLLLLLLLLDMQPAARTVPPSAADGDDGRRKHPAAACLDSSACLTRLESLSRSSILDKSLQHWTYDYTEVVFFEKLKKNSNLNRLFVAKMTHVNEPLTEVWSTIYSAYDFIEI